MKRFLLIFSALTILALLPSCSSTGKKAPNRYKKYSIDPTGQLPGQWEVRDSSGGTTIGFNR